jgi:hypothetical protein
MLDEPPEAIVLEAPEAGEVQPHLPTHERADGSLVIDLTPLAPPPAECLEREPDPFNPEIVVCRELTLSPRLGADYGPTADEVLEGSAVPRARLQLSEDASLEANVANQAVGGFNASGGEVRARIKF